MPVPTSLKKLYLFRFIKRVSLSLINNIYNHTENMNRGVYVLNLRY